MWTDPAIHFEAKCYSQASRPHSVDRAAIRVNLSLEVWGGGVGAPPPGSSVFRARGVRAKTVGELWPDADRKGPRRIQSVDIPHTRTPAKPPVDAITSPQRVFNFGRVASIAGVGGMQKVASLRPGASRRSVPIKTEMPPSLAAAPRHKLKSAASAKPELAPVEIREPMPIREAGRVRPAKTGVNFAPGLMVLDRFIFIGTTL